MMSESFVRENQQPLVPTALLKVNTEPATPLTPHSYLNKSLLLGKQISSFIEQLPSYGADFWQAYQRPVKLLAWLLGAAIALKILLAVLDAIDDIPFLAPSLKFVELAYTGWFAYHYLISFDGRQELSAKLSNLKDYFFGQI